MSLDIDGPCDSVSPKDNPKDIIRFYVEPAMLPAEKTKLGFGNMNSVDWNGGMERWSGLLEWSTGLDYWSATPTNAQFGPTSMATNLISIKQ